MTLNDFLDRLNELRSIAGGDVDVAVGTDDPFVFEMAMAEIQSVLPESFRNERDELCWRTSADRKSMAHTLSIVAIV